METTVMGLYVLLQLSNRNSTISHGQRFLGGQTKALTSLPLNSPLQSRVGTHYEREEIGQWLGKASLLASKNLNPKTLKPESRHTQPLTPNSLHLNQVGPPAAAYRDRLLGREHQTLAKRLRLRFRV